MPGANILAIGHYEEKDLQPMRASGEVQAVGSLDEIAGLPESVRAGIGAMAFRSHGPLDGAVMDLLPGLGLIANFGVGYDAIDVAAARARGVRVTNTPDVLTDDVADLAVAMLLAQSRRIVRRLGPDPGHGTGQDRQHHLRCHSRKDRHRLRRQRDQLPGLARAQARYL